MLWLASATHPHTPDVYLNHLAGPDHTAATGNTTTLQALLTRPDLTDDLYTTAVTTLLSHLNLQPPAVTPTRTTPLHVVLGDQLPAIGHQHWVDLVHALGRYLDAPTAHAALNRGADHRPSLLLIARQLLATPVNPELTRTALTLLLRARQFTADHLPALVGLHAEQPTGEPVTNNATLPATTARGALATLTHAADHPYPPHTTVEQIATRLQHTERTVLTIRCILLRSGTRAPHVLRAALTPTNQDVLWAAAATTGHLPHRLRVHAAHHDLTRTDPPLADTLIGDLLTDPRTPADLTNQYLIGHPRLDLATTRQLLNRGDQSTDALDVALANLPPPSHHTGIPHAVAHALTSPHATAQQRARGTDYVTGSLPPEEATGLLQLIDTSATRTWGDLPAEPFTSPHGHREMATDRILHDALTGLVPQVRTRDTAQVLTALAPGFTGTLTELFTTAVALSS